MVEHRGVINVIHASLAKFGVERSSRVVQLASLTFDASVLEIFTAWLSGSVLYLIKREDLVSSADLGGFLGRNEITIMAIPPSLLELIPVGEYPALRTVVVGGEACSAEVAGRWGRGRRLLNAYAPTEATIYATVMSCEEGEGGKPGIGKPIANTRVYILDGEGGPVPVGVAGEMYIGGTGVARGYLNRAEQTAERFVCDPFVGEAGGRMYKTGDVGRWRADGNIEFVGRNDFQVKIRGYRIELGEIEARLAEEPGVGEVVVMAREDTAGEKRLVAYYTCGEGGAAMGAEELRAHLGAKLPEYMVPAAYVQLDELPLTANGKLDRRGLPAPESDAYAVGGYEPPEGEIETRLAAIWAEMLKLERVGRHDNFFALGGHSLLAVRVVTRMQQAFSVNLSTRDLFARPVIAGLAEHIINAKLEQFAPNELAQLLRLMRQA
jgi:acyl-CoA synthetase (AMP-forming)/AMP-acid ligase II